MLMRISLCMYGAYSIISIITATACLHSLVLAIIGPPTLQTLQVHDDSMFLYNTHCILFFIDLKEKSHKRLITKNEFGGFHAGQCSANEFSSAWRIERHSTLSYMNHIKGEQLIDLEQPLVKVRGSIPRVQHLALLES